MNRISRVIWNHILNLSDFTSDKTTSSIKRSGGELGMRAAVEGGMLDAAAHSTWRSWLPTVFGLVFAATNVAAQTSSGAYVLPTDGSFNAAIIAVSNHANTIGDFDFGRPPVSAVALDRAVNNNSSQIIGSPFGVDKQVPINSNDVMLDQGVRVNVVGKIPTTTDLSIVDLMSGDYQVVRGDTSVNSAYLIGDRNNRVNSLGTTEVTKGSLKPISDTQRVANDLVSASVSEVSSSATGR